MCSLGYVRAALGGIADPSQRVSDVSIRLRCDLRAVMWPSVVRELRGRLCLPEVDDKALAGLKFSEALPATWRWPLWPPRSQTSITLQRC